MRKFKTPPTGRPRTPIAKRFWLHVTKTNKCWLWNGRKNIHGYGLIRGEGGRKGKELRAHRVSWELEYGPIPIGLFICHHCDNPSCVRPSHLFIGTQLENMRDCINKGRYNGLGIHPEWRRGNVKLNERKVATIRKLYKKGKRMIDIGKLFNVHRSTIGYIIQGKTWKHTNGNKE